MKGGFFRMGDGSIVFRNKEDSQGNIIGYEICHNGRDDWTFEGIEKHVSDNGHSKITAGVGVGIDYYWECCKLSERLEKYNK